MKSHFFLSRFAEVNVWHGSSPVPQYDYNDCVNFVPVDGLIVNPFSKVVVLEIKQPRGARCGYGLLGLNFTAGVESACQIRVPAGPGAIFGSSLIEGLETPRLGLPDESAFVIGESAYNQFCKMGAKPNGVADICYGAAGDVSSSISIFRALARALIYCAFANEILVEELNEIFK